MPTRKFLWHVVERPPTVVNPGPQHGLQHDKPTLGIEATHTTEYKALHLPKGLSINGATGVIAGELETVGEFLVKITVVGPGGTATIQFPWVVEKPCVHPTDPGAPWIEFKADPIVAQPGDAIISASSGNVYKNVNGKLEPLGAEQQLSVSGYQEVPGSKGKALGTFEVPASPKARFILCVFTINEAENFGTITVAGNTIAITERSGSVGVNYRTTLTVVLPPNVPAIIKGNNPTHVSINSLWESISS